MAAGESLGSPAAHADDAVIHNTDDTDDAAVHNTDDAHDASFDAMTQVAVAPCSPFSVTPGLDQYRPAQRTGLPGACDAERS